jgi:hypothetical protein
MTSKDWLVVKHHVLRALDAVNGAIQGYSSGTCLFDDGDSAPSGQSEEYRRLLAIQGGLHDAWFALPPEVTSNNFRG